MAGDRAVFAEHEDVVAKGLEVVLRVISQTLFAFVVQHRLFLVRGHRQMAAETTRRPRSVAGVTGHVAVGVRELILTRSRLAPFAFARDEFGPGRIVVVIAAASRDGVNRLHDAPPFARFDQRVLHDVARAQINLFAVERLALGRLRDALEHRYLAATFVARFDLRQVFRDRDDFAAEARRARRRAGSRQRRGLVNRAVAINAINLNRGARLVVQITVAVNVRADVAIGAMHAHLLMHVFKVDRLLEFFGIVRSDLRAAR
ncbi:MAG: hypothetical protein JMDDDDMK_03878 [Acidobacteria bacterium]|nr:hypothetical protein [Acidobacteriota bacterium]